MREPAVVGKSVVTKMSLWAMGTPSKGDVSPAAMRAVDTTGLQPLPHPIATIQDMALRLRDDVASEPNQREANQQSAPAVERGLFLVPKVIE